MIETPERNDDNMKKRLLALLLAGVMTLSLAACGDKSVQSDIPQGTLDTPSSGVPEGDGNEGSDTAVKPDDPVVDNTEPDVLYKLTTALADAGLTAELEILDNRISDFFLYPELDFNYELSVSNGETVYVYGYEDESKAAEHMACYDAEGDSYSHGDASVIIDYAYPVNFWHDGGMVIEYGSSYGSLYQIIVDAFGEPMVGSKDEHYYLDYAKPIFEALRKADYIPSLPKHIDAEENEVAEASYSEIYFSDGKTVGNLFIYKFDTLKDLNEHTASPIKEPVLDTITVWKDADRLVAYQYVGEDENISRILDDTYSSGKRQIGFHSVQYDRVDYTGNEEATSVVVYNSFEELFGGETVHLPDDSPYLWYDAGWFESHSLMVVTLVEGSGSNRHELESVTKSGNSITVNVKRIIPEVFTCDMATWNILVGINKSEIGESTEYLVNVITQQHTGNFIQLDYFDDNIIRTGYFGDGHDDKLIIIESFDELKEYYINNSENYNLSSNRDVYADTSVGFFDVVKDYDEKWFEENVLVMGMVEEGSGSIRHRIDGVYLEEDGRISLRYTKLMPEMGTDDMAGWHIMVALKKADIKGATEGYIYLNYTENVSRTLFPAAYITPERLEDVRKTMVGKYNRQDIRNFWGLPDAIASDISGYQYYLGKYVTIDVRFDGNGLVSSVDYLVTKPISGEITPDKINQDNLAEIERYFIETLVTDEDIKQMWGEPQGMLSGFYGIGYDISDSEMVWIYFYSSYSSASYVESMKIAKKAITTEELKLENITPDNFEQVKNFIMGATYEEICELWGKPYDETAGVGQSLYQIGGDMFISVSFDSDSKVISAEMLSRTPIEPR